MRIRRLLAAALLGGAMVFALAQPASADPSVEANKELKECLEKALDGPTSPPNAKPWIRRQTTTMKGAAQPMLA